MITKQTSANAAKFAELFNKVNTAFESEKGKAYAPTKTVEDSNGNKTTEIIKITTLDEYFAYIENIREMLLGVGDASGKDKSISDKLLILPLDENDFSIDANSRKITIPASFSRNGVGVAGDHFVETLYFTVDRYFDTIDFASDEIKAIVEWQNADGEKYYSPAWTKVLDDDEEKVIIGWVLTDKATSKAGTIKFSVRLFTLDTSGNLESSFGTLITSVVINPSMNFDIATASEDRALSEFGEIDDSKSVRAKLFSRLRNSPDLNKTAADVDLPKYIVRYYKVSPGGEMELKLDGGATADEIIEADVGDTLFVFAEADVGEVYYEWSDNSHLETSTTYIPLTTYRDGTWYVYNESEKYYALSDDASEETVKDGKHLVKVGKAVIKAEGDATTTADTDYYCLAKNRAYGYVRPDKYVDLVSEGEDCRIGKVHVPGPTDFAITDIASPVALSNEGVVTLSIIDTINEKEQAVYTWSKAAFNSGDFIDIANSNALSCNVNDEGKYQVKVVHTRNGASIEKEFANPVIVYAPIVSPVSLTNTSSSTQLDAGFSDQSVELTIRGNNTVYSWHWNLNGTTLDGGKGAATEYSNGTKIYPVLPANCITVTGGYQLVIEAVKTGFEGAENIKDTFTYTYTYLVPHEDDN